VAAGVPAMAVGIGEIREIYFARILRKIWSASEGKAMVRFQYSASKISGFLLLGSLVLTGILLFSDEV
jgi:hypothetical protein